MYIIKEEEHFQIFTKYLGHFIIACNAAKATAAAPNISACVYMYIYMRSASHIAFLIGETIRGNIPAKYKALTVFPQARAS